MDLNTGFVLLHSWAHQEPTMIVGGLTQLPVGIKERSLKVWDRLNRVRKGKGLVSTPSQHLSSQLLS